MLYNGTYFTWLIVSKACLTTYIFDGKMYPLLQKIYVCKTFKKLLTINLLVFINRMILNLSQNVEYLKLFLKTKF